MSDGPKSGRRLIRRPTTAYVLVKVDAVADDDAFDINAMLAVDAAVAGLDVPGATVLRVSAQPFDAQPRPVVDCPSVPRKG